MIIPDKEINKKLMITSIILDVILIILLIIK